MSTGFTTAAVSRGLEAGVGIEPAYTDLQSAAWPLCHPAMPCAVYPDWRAGSLSGTSSKRGSPSDFPLNVGAGNEARTRDLNLGKVALYQLSYSRNASRDYIGRAQPVKTDAVQRLPDRCGQASRR